MAYLYPNRTALFIKGADAQNFLQGLVSADMRKLKDIPVIYSLILDQKGDFTADFFIWRDEDDNFILELDTHVAPQIQKILKFYKLRAQVDISEGQDIYIYAHHRAMDGFEEDPRLPQQLYRGIFRTKQDFPEDFDYPLFRIQHCLLEHGDAKQGDTPIEIGLDALNAIAYDKGCYLGQEGANKAKRLLKIKREMRAFSSDVSYNKDDIIHTDANREIAEVRFFHHNHGLMLLKTKYIDQLPAHIKLL